MIYCCSAYVQLDKPMNVLGYPQSRMITITAKVRTEGQEPSPKAITEAVIRKMNACYDIGVISVSSPSVDFTI